MEYVQLETLANRYEKEFNSYDNYTYFPKLYSNISDIEVSGLFACALNYGKPLESMQAIENVLIDIMHNQPYEYISNGGYNDLIDNYNTLYNFHTYHTVGMLCDKLHKIYNNNSTIDDAILKVYHTNRNKINTYYQALQYLLFGDTMVMSPACKSGNKSINTYLRLMTCDKPINMGIWNLCKNNLFLPYDDEIQWAAKGLNILGLNEVSSYKNMIKITEYGKKVFPDCGYKLEYSLRQYYKENK